MNLNKKNRLVIFIIFLFILFFLIFSLRKIINNNGDLNTEENILEEEQNFREESQTGSTNS